MQRDVSFYIVRLRYNVYVYVRQGIRFFIYFFFYVNFIFLIPDCKKKRNKKKIFDLSNENLIFSLTLIL